MLTALVARVRACTGAAGSHCICVVLPGRSCSWSHCNCLLAGARARAQCLHMSMSCACQSLCHTVGAGAARVWAPAQGQRALSTSAAAAKREEEEEAQPPPQEDRDMQLLRRLNMHPEQLVAPPGFNRWRIVPAAAANHAAIGSIFTWSLFAPYLTRTKARRTASCWQDVWQTRSQSTDTPACVSRVVAVAGTHAASC